MKSQFKQTNTMIFLFLSYTVLLISSTTAFMPTRHPSYVITTNPINKKDSLHNLSILKESKGFGKNVSNNNNKSSKNKNINELDTSVSTDATTTTASTTTNNNIAIDTTPKISAGAEALARLRRQQAEQKDEELRAIRKMKSMEEYVANDPDAAVIPEQVAQRMGKRMLPFVGIPLFGVMGTFVLFWYLATYRNMEFQPAMVAFSTIAVLVVSLLVRLRKAL